ncbi:MAG: M4 family metallopeptidase, partial [Bacteroidetes bacterium]|nr:M4 family metallopeptidase [Bacteroidota bacterium]
FRLREAKRGNGIETYNLQKGTSYASAVDFTDTDTTWDNVNANYDEYATDAHFGSQMTYDFYKKSFNRNSIDNSGFKLKSYIHYSNNYVNAFWNGSYMTYGDGNGSTVYPLVSLDIAGHEITHGLTTKTANLTYSYESGALNESFSDIFGTAIEWYGDSSRFEWELGTKIGLTIRSMANPKAKSQPDTYKGTNWYVGSADNGGVHTNMWELVTNWLTQVKQYSLKIPITSTLHQLIMSFFVSMCCHRAAIQILPPYLVLIRLVQLFR